MQEKYALVTNGNEFLTIPEALEAVSARILSLLITDFVTRRLIGVRHYGGGAKENSNITEGPSQNVQ